ncbi:Transcriptional regulator PadR-like family protein [Candidatus Burarchaeum australiense]|nr:Transcriptional regulator PadR-like family protein [Candidatus Burarchaeum australiense]
MEDEHKLEKIGFRSLLRAYLLKSFGEGRKSGYDILREIRVKSGGKWKPSKGAVYPLITESERRGLIRVVETGARGVKRYALTPAGRKALLHFKEHARHLGEQYRAMGSVMGNVFGGFDPELHDLMVKARLLMLAKGGCSHAAIKKIMKRTVEELENV